ncbi:MAG TPA: hypothetical protein PL070_13855 [Flavobacteriales bacterium]|nr:hypothetical protein [Flavobacteriales bacterium]
MPSLRRTFLVFGFSASCAMLSATPIGERHVIVDQERLRTMSASDQAAVLDLQARLETVLATDRSALSSDERRALRKEYRGLKHEMAQYNAGGTVIYLSTGAIIIILLLLIILL